MATGSNYRVAFPNVCLSPMYRREKLKPLWVNSVRLISPWTVEPSPVGIQLASVTSLFSMLII